MRWTPRNIPIRVAYILVPQLIAAGKAASLRELLDAQIVPRPWDLIILVMLAAAGEPVHATEIEQSLKRIRRVFIPNPDRFSNSYGEDDWQKHLLNTFVVGCELSFRLKISDAALIATLTRILEVMEDKKRKLYSFDFHRVDALFRCWLLRAELLGQKSTVEEFLTYLKSI